MPYLGNSHIAGDHVNNFKVLDDISSYTATFDGSATSVVDTTNNTIRVVEHRFIQGQRVTYTNGGGGNIGGLTTGTAYFVIYDTAFTIKLATNASNAANSSAINLSSVGSGTSHTLNAAFDGTNTKFKLTHGSGVGARLNNATQLNVAINNVVQRPNVNSVSFTEGFAIEDNHKIVFKVAPTSEDIFWGSIIANTITTFDISDHKIDTFTGDGSTTEFTLSHTPANNESLMVTINGVLQHPSNASTARAYTLIASIIQFTAAPGVGDEIQVRHIGFAGATTADVSGFYGRTGNVVLTDQDDIIVNKISVGTGATIESNGQATFVGVVTFGSSSTTIEGDNNLIKVGTALTLGHTQGLQFHTQNLHSDGFEINNINASGIITASQFVGNIGGNPTFSGDTTFNGSVSIGGTLTYEDVTNIDSIGIVTARDGLKVLAGGANIVGVVTANTFKGDGDFVELDVDGHTNLDNVSIAGITTTENYFNSVAGYRVSNHPVVGYVAFTAISGGSYAATLGSTGTSTLRHTQIYGGGSVLATFDGVNNRLGIGTQVPDSTLHLKSASSPTIHLEDTTQTTKLKLYAQDANSVIGNYSNHRMNFVTNSLSRIQLTNDGKIQIGLPGNSESLAAGTSVVNIRAMSGGNLHIRPSSDLQGSTTGIGIDSLNDAGNTVTDLVLRGATTYFRNSSGETLRISSGGETKFTVGTNKTVKFYAASHNDETNLGAGLGFSRASDGAEMLTGIFSHSNTGLGVAARDHITFLTGGTSNVSDTEERLRIDSSGKIGIATATPATTLDVQGDMAVAYNATHALRFYTQARSNWSSISNTATDSNANLSFRSSQGEAMFITYNRKVGIGTNNPTAALDVRDASGSDPTFFIGHSDADVIGEAIRIGRVVPYSTIRYHSIKAEHSGGTASNMLAFHLHNGSTATSQTEVMRLRGDGRVGINSTNPSAPLEIYTAASAAWKFRIDTTVSDGVGFYQRANGDFEMVLRDASNNVNYIAGTSGALQFATSGSERLRIDSSGNVNIGSAANPGNTLRYLDVYNTNTGSSAGAILRLITTKSDGSSTAGLDIVKYKAGGAYIINNENVGADTGFIAFNTGSSGISPATHLRVAGNGEVIVTPRNGGASNNRTSIHFNNAAHTPFIAFKSNNLTEAAYIQVPESSGGANLQFKTKNTSGTLLSRLTLKNNGEIVTHQLAGGEKGYPLVMGTGTVNSNTNMSGSLNMHDINGVSSSGGPNYHIGGWVYLGNDNGPAPYPARRFKIFAPSAFSNGTIVYQVWHDGDSNYYYGGLWEIRINLWTDGHIEGVTLRCINGFRDDLKVFAYNDSNGIMIQTNTIWGRVFIRKFGWDDGGRNPGSSHCAVANNAALGIYNSQGTDDGAMPTSGSPVELYSFDGTSGSAGATHTGGYNIEGSAYFDG